MEERYLTTKEVAELLNVTTDTVRRYRYNGLLQPLDDHPKYRMRRTLLFPYNDVIALKEQKVIEGWTTTDAAKYLNTTSNTIYNRIQDGQIKAHKRHISDKKFRYIIPPEEVERIKQEWHMKQENQSTVYYDRQRQLYLFQPYRQFGTQKIARIIEMTEVVRLKNEDGRIFRLETALEENYKPLQSLKEGTYIQKKGYAVFIFPQPSSINHQAYDVIDWLMEHVGYKNVKIDITEHQVKLYVKPVFIKTNNHTDDFRFLQDHCEKGYIHHNLAGIEIDSDYEPIHAYVPKPLKAWLKEESEKHNMSQSDFIEYQLIQAKEKSSQNHDKI